MGDIWAARQQALCQQQLVLLRKHKLQVVHKQHHRLLQLNFTRRGCLSLKQQRPAQEQLTPHQ